MGSARQLKYKSGRKGKFYESKRRKLKAPLQIKCDKDVVNQYLDKITKTNKEIRKANKNKPFYEKEGVYMLTVNCSTEMALYDRNWVKYATSLKTKKAINELGWEDLSGWMFVNKMSYDRFKREYVADEGQGNWVLDLDNTEWESISDLREYISFNKILMPAFIAQTSKNNFHLLYRGSEKFWTDQKRLSIACMIGQIYEDNIPDDKDKLYELLKKNGVDPSYLRQSHKKHKIRLPGTVNHKTDGEEFVVLGWENEKYNEENPAVEFIDVEHREVEEDKVNNKIGLRIRDLCIDVVRKEVSEVLGRCKFADDIAELIAMNITLLSKGEMAISQTYFAEKIGTSQPAMSRALKKLRDAGILETSKEHVWTNDPDMKKLNRARSYQLGKEFMDKIGVSKSKFDYESSKAVERLREPYEAGNTNDLMIQDIRISYILGFDYDDCLELVRNKMMDRPPSSRRPDSDVFIAWRSFEAQIESGKFVAPRRESPPFEMSRLIQEC